MNKYCLKSVIIAFSFSPWEQVAGGLFWVHASCWHKSSFLYQRGNNYSNNSGNTNSHLPPDVSCTPAGMAFTWWKGNPENNCTQKNIWIFKCIKSRIRNVCTIFNPPVVLVCSPSSVDVPPSGQRSLEWWVCIPMRGRFSILCLSKLESWFSYCAWSSTVSFFVSCLARLWSWQVCSSLFSSALLSFLLCFLFASWLSDSCCCSFFFRLPEAL